MTDQHTDQLLLIDLSAIAHSIWHISGNEPDPNFVSTSIVSRVRALASAHPYAAVCCDNGKSFRRELDPTYKAQRDTENLAPLYHQMTLACEILKKDGFPVWSVKGFEADDIIATAVVEALNIEDTTVLIATSDKDLLQLVGDRVFVKKLKDGVVMDKAAVLEKFKVSPSQMGDYLALVGDTSDNIVGAKGIGGVRASELLAEHGSLQHLYEKMAKGVVKGVTPAMRTSLMEFKDRWPAVAALIALRTDVPIPFAEVAAERVAAPLGDDAMGGEPMTGFIEEDAPQVKPAPPKAIPVTRADVLYGFGPKPLIQAEAAPAAGTPATPAGEVPVPVSPETTLPAVIPAPVDFALELEPRNFDQAKTLAKIAFNSKQLGAYGTPEAILLTLLAGRELGYGAMASLRSFHIVENKPCLSADAMRSLVLKSGLAEYFRCTETTAESATFETKRKGDPTPMALSFSMAEAHQAGIVRRGSGWEKYPSDMLRARASAKLCRLVYPDVISGLYDPSELA